VLNFVPMWRSSRAAAAFQKSISSRRKNITLYFWKNEELCREKKVFLCTPSLSDNLRQIVGSWMEEVYDERILCRQVRLQSVAVSGSGQEIFLSFDQNPCDRDWSIFRKWQFWEGLLKTIADAPFSVQSVFFLVNHEPMPDDHLDFSLPLPVGGFESTANS